MTGHENGDLLIQATTP